MAYNLNNFLPRIKRTKAGMRKVLSSLTAKCIAINTAPTTKSIAPVMQIPMHFKFVLDVQPQQRLLHRVCDLVV